MSDITDDQIREWDNIIRSGGSVVLPEPGDGTGAYVFAVIRRLNGLGVDRTDPDGEVARERVNEVLNVSR